MMSAPAPYPMVQSSAPAIDDHEITTRTPSICVDYLSHNWTDEDVWSSWKAMTKRKNEIANGVRLENASWRTWAKQRGKLKTISPETLNWLKDSDVTWLYGPLHEHAEPVPPPKQATARERLGLEDSQRTKSILKHRTISELLTTPGLSANSPATETPPAVGGGSGNTSHEGSDGEPEEPEPIRPTRPGMKYIKSETALSETVHARRGGSPPASERLLRNLASNEGIAPVQIHEEKRHISFNQRVDQCIAVDAIDEDDGDDEDDEEYSDGMYDTARHDEDGSSSDEEVLTMKSSPRGAPAWPAIHSAKNGNLTALEHQTIAKLAPTMLKTSDTYPAPSPQVVDPSGFSAHFNGGTEGPLASGTDGQPRLSAQPQMYGFDSQQDEDEMSSQTRYSQWDADDDFNGDFDYFNGPDVHDSYQTSSSQQQTQRLRADSNGEGPSASDRESTDSGNSGPPRSILKRRTANAPEDDSRQDGPSTRFSPPSSPEVNQPTPASPPSQQSKVRGRTSQRVGSSASYERVQDAARGTVASPGSVSGGVRSRQSSANGTMYDQTGTEAASSSSIGSSSSTSSPPLRSAGGSDRRESFRSGKAGDGSRAMLSGPSAGHSQSLRRDQEADSDGRDSFDFYSPGYPASPQLGEKEGDTESGDEDKLYGRKKDAQQWADARQRHGRRSGGFPSSSKQDSSGVGALRDGEGFADDDDEEEVEELEPSARLSVDLGNLPSNSQNSPGSAQGGPTPLNTPTFALAKSRSGGAGSSGSGGKRRSGGGSSVKAASTGESASGHTPTSSSDDQPLPPDSPLLPRRSSATGALVAPSHADKDAGVRVPLAHDYVEEDEGGIVGRAVEIVNTARDLIGALLGTGGDRGGRSWRD